MPVFKPNSGKNQDLGGVYQDGKIQNYEDHIVEVEPTSDHGTSADCCKDYCFVDQSGVPYTTDVNGCYVIPRSSVSISGLDVCDYMNTNCPTYNTSSFSVESGVLTLGLSDGTNDTVVIPIVAASTTTSGEGTHVSPFSGLDLNITQTAGDDISIDLRSMCYLELGQAGPLAVDGAAKDQHRFIVPEGFVIDVCRAYVTLAKAGSTSTTVYFYNTADAGSGVAPTPGAASASVTLASGVVWSRWADVETTYSSLRHLQERVQTAGTGAEDLVVHLWYRMNPCT